MFSCIIHLQRNKGSLDVMNDWYVGDRALSGLITELIKLNAEKTFVDRL